MAKNYTKDADGTIRFTDASTDSSGIVGNPDTDPDYLAFIAGKGKVLATSAPAITWPQYQAQAQGLLNKSDITMLRCVENGVAVPTEWTAWRKTLRAIIGAATPSDPTQPLPSMPKSFPTGS